MNKEKLTMNVLFSGIGCQERGFEKNKFHLSRRNKMPEYHVGCGTFGIYAGTLNSKNKSLWQSKTECTDEAINAVRDYMV